MTTLTERPNTALVVIDVQNDVVNGVHARDTVIENITSLVDRARQAGTPVVWVQHSDDELVEGSEGWRYVTELPRRDSEPLVPKTYGDAFEATSLQSVLADLGIGHLVVAGAETDACIRSTIHGAFARGYDVTLVSDAHTAQDKTEWGRPAGAAGDRAHESLLEPPVGPGSYGPGGRHRRRVLPPLDQQRPAPRAVLDPELTHVREPGIKIGPQR